VQNAVLQDVSAGPSANGTGDLNGDKNPDLVSAPNGALSVLQGSGQGGFITPSPTPAARGAGAGELGVETVADLAIADVNGDGFLDVIAAVAGALPNTDALTTFIGDGSFQPSAGPRSSISARPLRLQMVELTEDGSIDVAVATSSGLELLRNSGDGGLETIAVLDSGHLVTDVATGTTISDRGRGLVAALPEQDAVKVYGRRGGLIAETTSIAVEDPRAVVAGDFTGDGIDDVVVASGAGFVVIYVGRANGGFASPRESSVPITAKRLVRTDVNGDGLADVVALERDQTSVQLMIGHGDTTFDVQPGPSADGPATGLAVADVNGDRVPDLLMSGATIGLSITTLSGPPIEAGDASGEGDVDADDLEQLVSELFDGDGIDAFSCGGGTVASAAGVDANGDGLVTAADLIATLMQTVP
jgi:hypothetical protein